MDCQLCGVTKLPNEFAPETVTDTCEHPVLFCLRCTLKAVKETSKCPHPGCNQPVKLSDKKMLWFQAILDDMFKEYDADDSAYDSPVAQSTKYAGGILTITVLTGENMAVPYDPNMEVLQLKRKISQTMNHVVEKQKLLYKEGELACTLKAVKETSKCPHPGCNQPVKLSDKKMLWFQAILDDMFKEYDADDSAYDSPVAQSTKYAGGILTITVLTGENMAVPYDPNMEVLQLKRKISQTMNHVVEKQKLLYKEGELADYCSNGRRARILDFGVKPNSTLCLVIILFSVPENFDRVVFDLFWGYPTTGCDYLDASCLLYNGQSYVTLCDFRNGQSLPAVRHSGDVMDNAKKIGHHTINVSLKQLPSNITHLFFTLSAWRSPNISRYPNPSLTFHEASNPTKDLCKTTFHHASMSQAVVMCSASRGAHGSWEIFESGKLSSGNAMNYDPIKSTVRSLISQGF